MFSSIKTAVQKQFDRLTKTGELFVVRLGVDESDGAGGNKKDELFDAYIQALPPEERAEHICNCCKHFLRNYGYIVAFVNGKLETLWDIDVPAPYNKVPAVLRQMVLSKPIVGPFLSPFAKLGTDFNNVKLDNGRIHRWDHFFVELPKAMVYTGSDSVATKLSELQGSQQVFDRSLRELTMDSAETVLALIAENNLYKGAEFRNSVEQFYKHKKAFEKLDETSKATYAWQFYKSATPIRNTAIGTLLDDLSAGKPEEVSVASYEAKVAPSSYKRTTGLVTEKMVKAARETIEKLGRTKSLERRHATPDDFKLNNLLYVLREGFKMDSVFDSMAADAPVNPKSFERAKEVTLDEFIQNILPNASNVQLLLENSHSFVSLLAPVHEDAPGLFAWDNGISWTYETNNTDVIKEKVKKAGGSVTGELRASLEWFNYDDLDLWVTEPGGTKIWFRNRSSTVSGGTLDVDRNAGGSHTREPVENIIFQHKGRMKPGTYRVEVNNFSKRENVDFGFNMEIECQGQVYNLSYPNAVRDNETVLVATFDYTQKDGITNFKSALQEKHSQREVHGLLTGRFQKVNMMMFSPNHWEGAKGNKHLFFILDKAKVDVPLRPFFNEYLHEDLVRDHRKVFEVLGGKLMVPPAENQVSGVGFSLTQHNKLIVKVNNIVHKIVI